VIEVDGEAHRMGDRPARDASRDDWLRAQSVRIVRFAALDVMRDLDAVLTAIMLACRR